MSESDYNNLVKSYAMVDCLLSLFKPNVNDSMTINPFSFRETLGVIEDLAESVFSAEIIKNEHYHDIAGELGASKKAVRGAL